MWGLVGGKGNRSKLIFKLCELKINLQTCTWKKYVTGLTLSSQAGYRLWLGDYQHPSGRQANVWNWGLSGKSFSMFYLWSISDKNSPLHSYDKNMLVVQLNMRGHLLWAWQSTGTGCPGRKKCQKWEYILKQQNPNLMTSLNKAFVNSKICNFRHRMLPTLF